MPVRATVLCENTVNSLLGIGEAGWAIWLETPSNNYLFDTGLGKGLLHNAQVLGVKLATADAIMISHHHLDHTGGLRDALAVMRGGPGGTGVPVHAHLDLFKDSYAIPKGKRPQHIGMPFSRAAIEGSGAVLCLDTDWMAVEDGVYLTGEVPRRTDFELGDPDLKHFDTHGELVVDPILDDQALVVETFKGLFVVLGCSHAGVVNTLNYIVEKTGRADFHTVIGGTHLGSVGQEQVSRTVDALLTFDIQRIGVSHCTGPKPAVQIADAFGDRFFYCNVGTVVKL